uniref:Retrovirus-related Pol polyprotein from transposon TNT 1-94-like beta-barrel domain-containing protein n=1 Tax=Aegilops tauschii subsp. strangulata TaxID=200361 RepID=A0A453TCD5_AEGTS
MGQGRPRHHPVDLSACLHGDLQPRLPRRHQRHLPLGGSTSTLPGQRRRPRQHPPHRAPQHTVQGDSQVGVYCQRLKSIMDELRELGDPLDDRQLINVLLVGLGERFEKYASFIPMMRPPPSFAEVRSMLQWADRAITNKESRPQVFVATPRPPSPAPAAPPMTPIQPPPGWRPSPNYRGKNPIYRPPSPSSSPSRPPTAPAPPPNATSPPAPPAWRPPHDPWTGLVQAWPMPWTAPSPIGAPPAYSGSWMPGMRPHTRSPGLLGSCPPTQAYHAAPTPYCSAPELYFIDNNGLYHPQPLLQSSSITPHQLHGPPPPSPAPPLLASPTPHWDQAAFLQVMNHFAAQGTSGMDWIFDSGASSHMSNSSTMLSNCTSSPFSSITLGNGSTIPIYSTGHTELPSTLKPLLL